MSAYVGNITFNTRNMKANDFWSEVSGSFSAIHRVHWYPAKFPPALVQKSIKYFEDKGMQIDTIADCFCGCGTTSFESNRLGYNFWGCDINPVATLITRVKTNVYDIDVLKAFFSKIVSAYSCSNKVMENPYINNERICYWFDEKHIQELNILLTIIRDFGLEKNYEDFFLCAFSNILRLCSRWLMKSIKPQIDPLKKSPQVIDAFVSQVEMMIKALIESSTKRQNKSIVINTDNFVNMKVESGLADLIITSPPYVTSYEYADLHQLSTLWLGYVQDYRELRKGTVGSRYFSNLEEFKNYPINDIGKNILEKLIVCQKNKFKEISKYFIDMDKAVSNMYCILKPKGGVSLVIGNTEYGGVYIDNASYIAESMRNAGFQEINIEKREIRNKILTSYRDKRGKFSRQSSGKKVYNEEFIITARKML